MTTSPLKRDDLRRVLDVAFTEEQLNAITAPLAPAVVIAGAGSGKTAVMSARVVWLVASGQVAPESVLGLTFTNKAAAELAQRVRRALVQLRQSGIEVAEGDPTISTYHSYAAALLREYGLRGGYEPGARLLADAARYQLAERVVRRATGPFAALRLRVAGLTFAVVALDSELNEHLVEPAAVATYDAQLLQTLAEAEQRRGSLTARPFTARKTAEARDELLTLVGHYREDKRRFEVVDFGDQMAGAARLAEAFVEVGRGERERFSSILLDEYQDTSIAQKRLLLALFGPGYPVMAVGDPFQAIYGWRGASVRNIMSFAQEFSPPTRPAPVFALSQNNRSGQRILDLANVIAEPLRTAHPQVASLRPRPDRLAQGSIDVGLYASRDDELVAISDDIARKVATGAEPRSIAVLFRDSASFGALHRALTERDVPVEVVGLGGLLELPEIVDLVSTLEVLDDPAANPAMLRLLTGPRWRIGSRDLALLGERARELVAGHGASNPERGLAQTLLDAVSGIDPAEVVSLAEAVHDPGDGAFSAAARGRFAALDAELADLRQHRTDALPELVAHVLDVTGLAVEVAATGHGARTGRSDQLRTFLAEIAAFADLDGSATLGSFLAFLAASIEYQGGLDTAAPNTSNSVKVMTLHKAKGLEWACVYLPHLCVQVFPSSRVRSLWTASPQVLPFALRGDAADFPTVGDWSGNKGCDRFRDEMKDKELIEERRLAYVGVTRAEHELVLTGHWWGPTQVKRRGPNDYLVRAHEFCLAGGGQVRHWEQAPPEDATNPALAATAPTAWPVPLDPVAAAGRHEGARLVLDALKSSADPDSAALTEASDPRVADWDADLAALVAEARELHSPDRTVVLPAGLSASALVRLARDPAGLAEDLARPMPRRPAPAARRGTQFHAWVQSRFGQASLIDLDELDDAGQPADAADLAELQEAFLAGPYAERAPLVVEAPFQLVVGGHAVSGRIDAVYRVPDHPDDVLPCFEVVDWKTGRSAADPLQLAIYRLAWAELQNVPLDHVTAAFYYVARGSVEFVDQLPGRVELAALLSP